MGSISRLRCLAVPGPPNPGLSRPGLQVTVPPPGISPAIQRVAVCDGDLSDVPSRPVEVEDPDPTVIDARPIEPAGDCLAPNQAHQSYARF